MTDKYIGGKLAPHSYYPNSSKGYQQKSSERLHNAYLEIHVAVEHQLVAQR